MPQDDVWKYRIAAYRPSPEVGKYSPAPEAEATLWFGFRERGNDCRVFGVFPSRVDAEKAVEMLKQEESPYKKLLAEAAHQPTPRTGKGIDR
jgi:hypothetical protein